jgi:hypothetical protein
MNLLEGIGSVLSLIVLLVWIWRVAQGCRRLLGPRFAVLGALIFVPLAVGADGAVYVLFKATQGPHAESAAYGALAALLVLFAAVPLAALFNLLALMALLACLSERPVFGLSVLIVLLFGAGLLLAWMGGSGSPHRPESDGPSARRGDDRALQGQEWAMETGPASREECDRASDDADFRRGCYRALQVFERGAGR